MPLQWRNQIWQSLEEGAGKRCSECDPEFHTMLGEKVACETVSPPRLCILSCSTGAALHDTPVAAFHLQGFRYRRLPCREDCYR